MTDPPPDDLDDLVGRVADEFTDRCQRGERPDVEEYAVRHPAIAAVLRQVLPAVRLLGVTPTSVPEPTPSGVGPYEVMELLGRGGMGVVYKARDTRVGRIVALKLLPVGTADRDRLRLEGRIVAHLHHPNVVQLYEVGEHDGRPYLVLEYVPGGTLAEHLAQHPLTPRVSAAVVARLADAVQTAHAAGVIHRDLKPGNVLLAAATADGDLPFTPKVTDFGLAKSDTESADRTRTGAILGTPGYMAPEQAAGGRHVGPAADVYALGAVLYHALTGSPPFDGASTLDVLEKVRTAEPIPPRKANPAVPRDLETICLKCLRKEPHDRYETAAELADDLRRFLDARPIAARPTGRVERAVKWARRRPTAAAAYGLLGLSVLLGGLGAGAAWLWQRADSDRADAVLARNDAQSLRDQAEAGLARESELRAELDRLNVIRQADLAHRDWLAGDLGSGLARLAQTASSPHRGWEWDYVYHLYHSGFTRLELPPGGMVHEFASNADGSLFVARWEDPKAAVTELLIWDLTSLPPSPPVRLKTDPRATSIAVHPNAAEVFVGTEAGTVERWDVRRKRRNDTRKVAESRVIGVIVGPAARRVFTLADRAVVAWDWDTSRVRQRFPFPDGSGLTMAVTAEADRLAVPAGGEVHVWNVETGDRILNLPGLTPVRSLAFDSAGRLLAGSSRGGGKVWVREIETGRPVFDQRTVDAAPMTAFAADGRLLVSEQGIVRVWNPRTGQPGRVYRGPTAPVAGFATVGKRVAAAEMFGAIYVWDPADDPERVTFQSHPDANAIAFRPGTSQIATCAKDPTIRVWDGATGQFVRAFPSGADKVMSVAFTPDGTTLAAGCNDGITRLWHADTGAARHVLPGAKGGCVVAFSPNGHLLAGADPNGGQVFLWNVETGGEIRRWTGLPVGVGFPTFSTDGTELAVTSGFWQWVRERGDVFAWEVESGRPLASFGGKDLVARWPVFTPDARYLLAASVVRPTVDVWDVRVGTKVRSFDGLGEPADGIAITPDGSRLVTVQGNRRLQMRDFRTGQECLTIRVPEPDAPMRVAISLDGRRVAVGCWSGVVYVYHAPLPAGDPPPVRPAAAGRLATSPSPHGPAHPDGPPH